MAGKDSKNLKFKAVTDNRLRSNSLNNLPGVSKFFKRKRGEEDDDESKHAIFDNDDPIYIEMVKKFEDFSKQMHAEFTKQIEEIKKRMQSEKKKELKVLKTEFNQREEELGKESKANKEKWEVEKSILKEELECYKKRLENLENAKNSSYASEQDIQNIQTKLQALEIKQERRERSERRNNIVIFGAKLDNNVKEKKVEVQEMIADSLKINVEIATAYKINEDKKGGDIIIAKFNTYEDKIKIMENKKLLRNYKHKIFIYNSLTKYERDCMKKKRLNQQAHLRNDSETKEPSAEEGKWFSQKLDEMLAILNKH